MQHIKTRYNEPWIKELEQRNRDFETDLSLFQMISSTLNPVREINIAIELITRSLDVDSSYVLIFDKEQVLLDAYYGFPESATSDLINILQNLGGKHTILKQHDPVFMECIPETNNRLLSYLVKKNYRSYASIPIQIAGETIGAIGLASFKEYQFERLNQEILQILCRQLSILIENYRRYEEILFSKTSNKLDKMRLSALAEISHELRTPLTTIKGFASSLLQTDIDFDKETRTSFIQAIDNESDRLKHLIDDLLVISRIEAGIFQLKRENLAISTIIDSVRDRLYSITPKHNLRINLPNDAVFVLVDNIRIGEVITNLVDNAAKYSPEGTAIVLEMNVVGDAIVTKVIDHGMGIPSEYHKKIFERFFRIPGVNHQKSTGLGLYISHGIVKAHGGKIWVNGIPGEGSIFSFSLPISSSE